MTVLLLLCCFIANAQDFSLENIDYNITSEENMTVEVVGSHFYYDEEVVIPSSVNYNGNVYNVTVIGERAFQCSSLTSVVVSEGIVTIGNRAFGGCLGLVSITLPESLKNMGESVFDCCGRLEAITIPSGVKSIGERAFEDCDALNTVVLSEGLDEIGYSAFSCCTSLKSITFPESLTKICDFAFWGCGSLTDIIIPKGIVNIGVASFGLCDLTSIVVSEDNVVYDSRNNCNAIIKTEDNELVVGCVATKIPEGIVSIGSNAFRGCEGLTTLTLPESLTNIGDEAFEGCENLASITIPDNVTYIGDYAFYFTGLTSIIIPQNVTRLNEGVFQECYNLTSIHIPENITSIGIGAFAFTGIKAIEIPKGVTEIGFAAFACCNDLTSITVDENNAVYDSRNNCNAIIRTQDNTLMAACSTTEIPEGIAAIGAFAFAGLEDLVSVRIPESVVKIEEGAFAECGNLTAVNIPSGVTRIEGETFADCSSLTTIIIPMGVRSIGSRAFESCEALASIICKATTPPSIESWQTFGEVDKNIPVYVPGGSIADYQNAEEWKEFTNFVAIPTYKVYYYVGEELVHTAEVAYGDAIPEYVYAPTTEGDVFVGWIGETYETMPAHDVTYTANIESGIEQLTIGNSQLTIYDLTGRRITNAENLKGGIYIINGKKVVIK